MDFKICKDIKECKALWKSFSPNQRLFDVWDYRACFFDNSDDVPYFILGYENSELVGIVPLCFSKSENRYIYFGGWFPERNSFFLRDKSKLAEFLEQCPQNLLIEAIDPAEGRYFDFPNDEYTFFLDLGKYNLDFENYFGAFAKKRRKKIKWELNKIPAYRIYKNRTEDFMRLVDLNFMQWDEDSKLCNPVIRNGIFKIMNLAKKEKTLDMTSISINGRVEAVDIAVMKNDWYYALIGGANIHKIPNIGKLMTITSIQNALKRKRRYVDFFATHGLWKEFWNFEKEMLLKFVK